MTLTLFTQKNKNLPIFTAIILGNWKMKLKINLFFLIIFPEFYLSNLFCKGKTHKT